MADPTFHKRQGPFRLSELAKLAHAELPEDIHDDTLIEDIAPLSEAGPSQLTFFDNPKYRDEFIACRAAACVVHPKFRDLSPTGVTLLLSEQPYLSFARIAQLYYPRRPVKAGIAASAEIAASAKIDPTAEIGPFVSIGADVIIGSETVIDAHCMIEAGVTIGSKCRLLGMVKVSHAKIGDNVTLHPGVKIGQDGFGFAPDAAGHVRVPQIGRVIIGANCDIGANTTIDRGSLNDTILAEDCWIDNQVQVAHNVEIGRGCIIAAQAGIAGSTKIGNFVMIGGQAGIAGHVEIGDGAQLAATSGTMSDVPAGARMSGIPAIPIREFFRQVATMRRLIDKKRPKA
jgi:UDP-3-O-[3-hydroxymyristoyl] glucosamine N-acyltransferase